MSLINIFLILSISIIVQANINLFSLTIEIPNRDYNSDYDYDVESNGNNLNLHCYDKSEILLIRNEFYSYEKVTSQKLAQPFLSSKKHSAPYTISNENIMKDLSINQYLFEHDDLLEQYISLYDAKSVNSDSSCVQSLQEFSLLCDRQESCKIELNYLREIYLHKCQKNSRYLTIEYQCISKKNIIDICSSTSMEKLSKSKSVNFVTPNYPQNYPSDQNCQCQLVILSANPNVELKKNFIRFHIEYHEIRSNCSRDRLTIEYMKDDLTMNNQLIDRANHSITDYCGKKSDKRILTNQQNKSQMKYQQQMKRNNHLPQFYLYSMSLNFFSNDALENYGFWLQLQLEEMDPLDVIRINCGGRILKENIKDLSEKYIQSHHSEPIEEKVMKANKKPLQRESTPMMPSTEEILRTVTNNKILLPNLNKESYERKSLNIRRKIEQYKRQQKQQKPQISFGTTPKSLRMNDVKLNENIILTTGKSTSSFYLGVIAILVCLFMVVIVVVIFMFRNRRKNFKSKSKSHIHHVGKDDENTISTSTNHPTNFIVQQKPSNPQSMNDYFIDFYTNPPISTMKLTGTTPTTTNSIPVQQFPKTSQQLHQQQILLNCQNMNGNKCVMVMPNINESDQLVLDNQVSYPFNYLTSTTTVIDNFPSSTPESSGNDEGRARKDHFETSDNSLSTTTTGTGDSFANRTMNKDEQKKKSNKSIRNSQSNLLIAPKNNKSKILPNSQQTKDGSTFLDHQHFSYSNQHHPNILNVNVSHENNSTQQILAQNDFQFFVPNSPPIVNCQKSSPIQTSGQNETSNNKESLSLSQSFHPNSTKWQGSNEKTLNPSVPFYVVYTNDNHMICVPSQPTLPQTKINHSSVIPITATTTSTIPPNSGSLNNVYDSIIYNGMELQTTMQNNQHFFGSTQNFLQ
ncbi:hypothetical protein SNEBB_001775 [Seison nebaliae]|nr:hypothetical protein SNEBB_001775 [Seison nebaliae]